MLTVLNLTNKRATPEQKALGVYELADGIELEKLYNFEGLPDGVNIEERALRIAELAYDYQVEDVLIGGEGVDFIITPLERELRNFEINVYYYWANPPSLISVQ